MSTSIIVITLNKSIYADQCVKTKIKKGQLLNLKSLPPWVPDSLRRTIRKAANINPKKRFPTASAFHVYLNNLKPAILNWVVESGYPTLIAATSFRVHLSDNEISIQKLRGSGQWRKDNSIDASDIQDAVEKINAKA